MTTTYALLLSQAAAVFVNNPEAWDYLVQCRKLAPSTVHVVPLGYDPKVARPRDLEACRQQLGLPKDERLIVHVGSLLSYKGTDTLLEAFARLNLQNASLIFVGDGEHRSELERLTRRSGLGTRVRFVGERPFDETPLWAGAADLTVGLSYINPLWGCCPTKVIEYVACGVPVLTNRMAITEELARVMPITLIADATSVDEVAKTLEELLRSQLRTRRVTDLPEAVQAYAWPNIARRTAEVFSSLVTN